MQVIYIFFGLLLAGSVLTLFMSRKEKRWSWLIAFLGALGTFSLGLRYLLYGGEFLPHSYFFCDSLSACILLGIGFFGMLVSLYTKEFLLPSSRFFTLFLLTLLAASGVAFSHNLFFLLFFKVDSLPAPLSAMLVETVPANWTLTSITINGITPSVLTSNGQNTGTLKWLFGPTGIAPLKDSVLSLTFTISPAIPGEEYLLSGWTETSTERTITVGDSFFLIEDPFCPADTDEDGIISDNEILGAIHRWASNSQFHGWPRLEEWDVWLLRLIEFWAADAYIYDSAASGTADYPRWRPL
jgi:hypothetical protein